MQLQTEPNTNSAGHAEAEMLKQKTADLLIKVMIEQSVLNERISRLEDRLKAAAA